MKGTIHGEQRSVGEDEMTYGKYFTLSYDDGPKHDRQFVKMLNERGLKYTFNLNSGAMPESAREEWRVSREEAAELYRGHEIATHALTHPHLEQLSAEDCDREIAEDIKNLSAIAGYPTLGHAYPYGTWNEDVVKVLEKNGIRYARTTRSTGGFEIPVRPLTLDPTCHHRDPRIFELIERFLDAEPSDGDLLFYLWGHSYEFDRNEEFNSWAHIDAIAGKKDVTYVTNMQFFDR